MKRVSAHINNVFLSFRLTWRDDPTLDLSRIKIQAFSDILCVLTLQYNCTETLFHISASKSCLFQRDNVLVRLLTYTTVTAKSKQNRHPWARQLGGALPVETWSGSDRPTLDQSIGRPLYILTLIIENGKKGLQSIVNWQRITQMKNIAMTMEKFFRIFMFHD